MSAARIAARRRSTTGACIRSAPNNSAGRDSLAADPTLSCPSRAVSTVRSTTRDMRFVARRPLTRSASARRPHHLALLLQRLGHQKGQLQALLSIQARVAVGMVAVLQAGVGDRLGAA